MGYVTCNANFDRRSDRWFCTWGTWLLIPMQRCFQVQQILRLLRIARLFRGKRCLWPSRGKFCLTNLLETLQVCTELLRWMMTVTTVDWLDVVFWRNFLLDVGWSKKNRYNFDTNPRSWFGSGVPGSFRRRVALYRLQLYLLRWVYTHFLFTWVQKNPRCIRRCPKIEILTMFFFKFNISRWTASSTNDDWLGTIG